MSIFKTSGLLARYRQGFFIFKNVEIMKTNEDFHSVDKKMSDEIMAEQTQPWTEECQACNGTGQAPRRFESEIIICENCSGKGEIEYEW